MIEGKFHRRVNDMVDRLILHKYIYFRNELNVSNRLMFHNWIKFTNK